MAMTRSESRKDELIFAPKGFACTAKDYAECRPGHKKFAVSYIRWGHILPGGWKRKLLKEGDFEEWQAGTHTLTFWLSSLVSSGIHRERAQWVKCLISIMRTWVLILRAHLQLAMKAPV